MGLTGCHQKFHGKSRRKSKKIFTKNSKKNEKRLSFYINDSEGSMMTISEIEQNLGIFDIFSILT